MSPWKRLKNWWSWRKLVKMVDNSTTYVNVGNYDEIVAHQNKKRMATIIEPQEEIFKDVPTEPDI